MDSKTGYLDGLRGIASLVVFIHHYICAFYPALVFGAGAAFHIGRVEAQVAASPLNLFYNGGFAVCIFFVLSGYVLTYKYFRTRQRDIIISSSVRRYIRLMVPIVFTLIIAYLLLITHLNYNGPASSITGSTWLASANSCIPNFLDVLKQGVWSVFFESPNQYKSLDSALWTISIEFMGSFLVFSFTMLFGDLKNRWIFYLGAGLVLLDTYYLAFIIGMLLSDLDSKNNEEYTLKNPFLKSGLLILGLFLGSYYIGGWWGMSLYNLTKLNLAQPSIFFRTIGAGILLLVTINSNCIKKILSTRIPLFLGRISFSMYLLHLLVIYSVSSMIFMALFDVVSYNAASVITFLATLPVVLGISCVTCRYVDEPGIRLSIKIYKWYFTDEPDSVDWKCAVRKPVSFTQKYLVEIVVFEIFLLITAIFSFILKSK